MGNDQYLAWSDPDAGRRGIIWGQPWGWRPVILYGATMSMKLAGDGWDSFTTEHRRPLAKRLKTYSGLICLA